MGSGAGMNFISRPGSVGKKNGAGLRGCTGSLGLFRS